MTAGRFALFAAAVVAGCVEHLPDQDLRILSAVPMAKMSPDDLRKDFDADAAAAGARYFGRAVEISGTIGSVDAAAGRLVFGRTGQPGVSARLLDEQAGEIVKRAVVGERITLRCFCEGLDEQRDVVLKSCVRP